MTVNYNDKILKIEEIGEEDEMLDIEVNKDHLFYANGILTKNSLGVPATADFMAIFGEDQNSLTYESELHYKIIKSRLGGRVGVIDKFYIDTRNLKMYDAIECDQWFEDAKISGDDRKMAQTSGE